MSHTFITKMFLNNEQRQQDSHWTDILIRQMVSPQILTIGLLWDMFIRCW